MAIDAKMIKELRDKTGMGITACKKALEESNGNLEEAEMALRKAGIDKAAKKADRATGEGVVAIKVSDDKSMAIIAEIACEQEPTTGNERFQGFVAKVMDMAFASDVKSAEELLSQSTEDGTLQDTLTNLIAALSENVQFKRLVRVEAPADGLIGSYVHFNKKAGAVCALKLDGADKGNAELQTAANDVCMHSVATRPVALDETGIPADILEKEKAVFEDQIKGKPAEIQEKILQGKLSKFYSDNCLIKQIFVKDPEGKQSVEDMVAAAGKAAGGSATIADFTRFELGL